MLRLCSASKTRAKILRDSGIEFIQSSVDFDEDALEFDNPYHFVYYASKGKLQRAEESFGLDIPLLTADSVVATPFGKILRKAKSIQEAREILDLLSGSEIAIISCVHLKSTKYLFVDTSATHYHFAPFDKEALESYLDSREWEGKAGACMVEGFCKAFIKEVRGLESTAMGLQIETLLPWLEVD